MEAPVIFTTAGTSTLVPARQELFGSTGALSHVGFHYELVLRPADPLWQTYTVGSSHLASHPAKFSIPTPSSLPPPYKTPSCSTICFIFCLNSCMNNYTFILFV
jgi:hypothetical protein